MLMFNHNTNQTILIYKYDEVFCSFIMHVLYYLQNQTLHNYYDYITVPLSCSNRRLTHFIVTPNAAPVYINNAMNPKTSAP